MVTEYTDFEIRQEALQLLKELHFRTSSNGTIYLMDMIPKAMPDGLLRGDMMALFFEVGKMRSTTHVEWSLKDIEKTTKRVERSVRYIISQTYDRVPGVFEMVLGIYEHPTAFEFINSAAIEITARLYQKN